VIVIREIDGRLECTVDDVSSSATPPPSSSTVSFERRLIEVMSRRRIDRLVLLERRFDGCGTATAASRDALGILGAAPRLPPDAQTRSSTRLLRRKLKCRSLCSSTSYVAGVRRIRGKLVASS
jgi:hypothetical protein